MSDDDGTADASALAGLELNKALLSFLVHRGHLEYADVVTVIGNAMFGLAETARARPELVPLVDRATETLFATMREFVHRDPASIPGQLRTGAIRRN